MKHKFLITLAAVALATPVSAAQIEFDLLEARFDNPVGGNVLSIDDTFGDPASIFWGQEGVDSPSGYTYDNRAVPFTESTDVVFGLGSFTHDNFPITTGTGISQVDLFITGNVTILDDMDNVLENIGATTFSFTVFHDETPNDADPCAYDTDANSAEFGCADRVTIEMAEGTDVFTVGGLTYSLSILGFSASIEDAANGIFDSEFFSAENGSNTRALAAVFTEVPAPAAAWLLLGGLVAVGGMRRRARKA